MNLRVGYDLDGCVYDLVHDFRSYLITYRDFHPSQVPWPKTYDFWPEWGMDKARWFGLLCEGIEDGKLLRAGLPIEGACAILNQLRAEGHSLHLVTFRNYSPSAPQITTEWLMKHRVPFDTLTFSQDKTVLPVDVFLEDSIVNARAIKDAGATPVLFHQTWNEDCGELIRVANWDQFGHIVRKLDVIAHRSAALTNTEWANRAMESPNNNGEIKLMRSFEGGATRHEATHKHDYEGFLSVHAVRAFGEYMHRNRLQADGQLRDSDNWQKGIPLETYMKSGFRHFMDWWSNHRDAPVVDFGLDEGSEGARVDANDAICGLLFNAMGYLHELNKP